MSFLAFCLKHNQIQANINSIPGANKVALFKYITEASLSYCVTDRKILNNQPVQRSEHLELIFSQFNSSVSKYKRLNSNSSSTLFQFGKKSEKGNAPLYVLNFTSNPAPL